MVVEKLPVVILPSGRVPGRVLLVLPILEAAAAAEQRWDREKSSCFEGFGRRFKYMPKGVASGDLGGPGAPRRGQGGGGAWAGRLEPLWAPSGPTLAAWKLPER